MKWSPTRVIVLMFLKSAALSFASTTTALVDDVGAAVERLPEDPPPHATNKTDASASARTPTHPRDTQRAVVVLYRIDLDTTLSGQRFSRCRTTSTARA